MFWFSGFRPAEEKAVGSARAAVISRTAVLAVAIAFLSIVLALVTYASFQTALVEQQVDQELKDMFEEPQYAEAGIIRGEEVRVDYKPADLLLNEPVGVALFVGYQAGQEIPPDIAIIADERLKKVTGKEVEVTVGFVVAQQTAA